MCGLNLILSTTPRPLQEPLAAMQRVSRFRGPDAAGVLTKKLANWQVAVGVNRLQVIDREAQSNQPMISACGNYVLAYNGEVYNYQDLRNRLLGKGYRFHTRSDTEVVLYWLQEFGEEGISALKGMFAFVFIDLQEKSILIARDRQGIKPLYWVRQNGLLLVSSSIKAIAASGLVGLHLNKAAVADYLAYRYVAGEQTFYRQVTAQPPGRITRISKTLQTTHRVMRVREPEATDIKEVLLESLTLQFAADPAPGLLLSGGVDSTLLLAMLRQELGLRGVATYTLATGEDAGWAQRAAKQFEASHQAIAVTEEVLWRLHEYLQQTDQPIGDMGGFATWLVAAEAGKQGNVLLSGAGADELFGGYNRHRAFYYYLHHRSASLRARQVLGRLPLRLLLSSRQQQFLAALNNDPQITYAGFLQTYAITNKQPATPLWPPTKYPDENMARALVHDTRNYLVADVLAITDNATMQHSVEARVPYLYDDVVAAAAAIPVPARMAGHGKAPLKKLLAAYGGTPYTQRQKQGFGLPMAKWLRQKNTGWLWEFLLHDSPLDEFIPKTRVYAFLKLHQQGKRDYSMQLWSILVLANWLHRN